MNQVTLGFLVVHIKHENTYITEVAKRSSSYPIDCVRFEPTSIDPVTLLINGEKFDVESNSWKEAMFPIPKYIYDRCFFHRKEVRQKSKPIVDWLKKYRETSFLGIGLPDKWAIYQALNTDLTISSYLPHTVMLKHPNEIMKHLKKHSSCLLKPRTGSRGAGIIAVFYDSKVIKIHYHHGRDKKTKHFNTIKDFTLWCKKLIEQRPYLLQPLLPLHDTSGYPFDIRLFVQKNHQGNWELLGKGIRRGYSGSFLSNLFSGGDSLSFDRFSLDLTDRQRILLEDELKTIIDHLPPLLEKKFHHLFELGIDIGYAQDGSVWILDINSKPGRKTIIETNPKLADRVYEAPLAYCQYLISKSQVKGVNLNG